MNVAVRDVHSIGSFEYRWPDSRERFDSGFEAVTEVDGETYQIRHGIGARHVYGGERTHTVTWVRGEPVVEGVGADDFASSGAAVSAIKSPGKKLVRSEADLPHGYERFDIVRHDEEVVAPYSRKALAVKIAADDVESWAILALLRSRSARAPMTPPREVDVAPPPTPPVAAALDDIASVTDKRAVADGLLRYASTYAHEEGQPLPPLTPDVEADRFVKSDPFAFLLAIVFDQGIAYERAWRAPLELRHRIGSIDPEVLASDPASVRAAVQQPPALHRFIDKMPAWLVSAARRVLDEYGGDAARIWAGSPTAKELQQRFLAFDGIGQKKAAMAIELLERHVGVPVRIMEGSDIAYDVHVRRVFLRAGLADRDDPTEMIREARELHPARPGALDDPAWRIGAQWCHRRNPECPACAIQDVCPKLIERGTAITGV